MTAQHDIHCQGNLGDNSPVAPLPFEENPAKWVGMRMRIHLRQIGTTALSAAFLVGSLTPASAASDFDMVSAARSAGASVSARVFQEADAAPEDSEREGERPVVSGKMVLLGAAMISAAIVGAAFILRGPCEPAGGAWLRLPRYQPPPGVPRPPPPPLPDMCVPR